MSCQSCAHATRTHARRYDNGFEISTYTAPEGKLRCDLLGIEMPPEFGCTYYVEGANPNKIEQVSGAPWQHWKMGNCPDCAGRGSGIQGGVCGRCVGTGQVRFYADGYVGEESTRRHPQEPEEEITIDPGRVLAPIPKADVLRY
jgi:hypothetical protein